LYYLQPVIKPLAPETKNKTEEFRNRLRVLFCFFQQTWYLHGEFVIPACLFPASTDVRKL